MKTKSGRVLLGVLVALVLVVGGIFVRTRIAETEKPIVWIHESAGHPFYAIVSLGFWAACDDLDVYCKEYAGEDPGVESKLAQCEIMLADTGTSGLIIMHDDDALNSCLEQLDAPWINFGAFNDAPNWLSHVGVDPLTNAVAAAEMMAEAVDYEGMILLSQCRFDDVANNVIAKFREVIESYPNMECSESIELGEEYTGQIGAASALLTKYPDAVGVFAATAFAPSTWTIVAQEHDLEPGDLTIIGYDPIRQNLDHVRDGWVYALIDQPFYDLTYLAVETHVAHQRGEEVPEQQMGTPNMVTAENVDDYYELADRIDEFLENRKDIQNK